jgi:type I restriction enzyme R subunit
MPTPEELAYRKIDALLEKRGWSIQDYNKIDLSTGRGIALRGVRLIQRRCDYLLFVDRNPVGVIKAKPEGATLSVVEEQTGLHAETVPDFLAQLFPAGVAKVPFVYESTGIETIFRDERDPHPCSRRVAAFHRPETLAKWLAEPGAPPPSPRRDAV